MLRERQKMRQNILICSRWSLKVWGRIRLLRDTKKETQLHGMLSICEGLFHNHPCIHELIIYGAIYNQCEVAHWCATNSPQACHRNLAMGGGFQSQQCSVSYQLFKKNWWCVLTIFVSHCSMKWKGWKSLINAKIVYKEACITSLNKKKPSLGAT